MFSSLRRIAFLGILAAGLVAFNPLPQTVQAQTGWEYVPELGGYLDWDTGLVWGEHSFRVTSSSWNWDGVNNKYLPNYRAATGIAAWRMPTVVEAQVAAAHGIAAAMTLPSNVSFSPCWTSESKSKGWAKSAHYAVTPAGGGTDLYNNRSGISFIPVYRAF
jgi:hypothetical protein